MVQVLQLHIFVGPFAIMINIVFGLHMWFVD